MTFSCVAREHLGEGGLWMERRIRMSVGVGESGQGG